MARLIDANKLIERLDKRIEWLRLDVHDKYSLGLYHGATTDKDLIGEMPTVVAFTEEQLSTILQEADGLKTINQKLETELVGLKNCLNCKIRKKCPRHCGKVVHGCDHWEYGDNSPTVDGELREIWQEDLVPFYERYPYIRKFKYDKGKKGWR